MNSTPTSAKVVLLAVEYAKQSDVESLEQLATQHSTILETDLVLRILLSYLPETTPPKIYTGLLQRLGAGQLESHAQARILPVVAEVGDLTDEQAAKKVRKLRLRKLVGSGSQAGDANDTLTVFLSQRAYVLDEEAGMLSHVTDLLVPFVNHAPAIRTWLASIVIPLCRKTLEYYSESQQSTLRDFQGLSDRAAVAYLLSNSGVGGTENLGRDLRGLLAPWLYNQSRWTSVIGEAENDSPECLGWEEFRGWLLLQGSKSWLVASEAVKQWDGPRDVDFGVDHGLELPNFQLQHLEQGYVSVILASALSVAEPTVDALSAAWDMSNKARSLLGVQESDSLQHTAATLPESWSVAVENINSSMPVSTLRNGLLDSQNVLTGPTEVATSFLQMLTLTAYIFTRLGISYTIRKAGDLILRKDARDQRVELGKFLRLAASQSSKSGDGYWARVRHEILWLHCPGSEVSPISESEGTGAFGMIPIHDIEAELLKAMISQSCFTLARTLYEDSPQARLSAESMQDAIFQAALDAFDNASNPNRTKGGLRKCNDIIYAFPKAAPSTTITSKQIEALLSAAHSLSSYRLVLKQGEPFSPIVLRVHSDPVSIIQKVLEQNQGAYTRLQEFLEIGANMAIASFLPQNKSRNLTQDQQDAAMAEAESRITAMCISAALKEDDFETAYSYVVSRFGGSGLTADTWSWKASLEAGEYIRSARTQLPTHLGTSSGNPEVRHLEQRLECLATALRIAPSSELQGILESFRCCEDDLDSAIREEAAKEAAWDMAGDTKKLPGSFEFSTPEGAYPPRNATASAAARQAEESPMSLFDLSRATARVASRNFTSLSSLHGLAQGGSSKEEDASLPYSEDQQRVRRRDQLREAATGTLVSGVGWLIGATPSRNEG